MTFTVKLADGTERNFDGAETMPMTHTYSIEANGVLVVISRVDGSAQTDRYSPAAWTSVTEKTTAAFPSPGMPGAPVPGNVRPIASPTTTERR